tara:strand:+ start:13 stop:459 length:447 start_codon:yes stop_codon:yes gene_type:complete
MSIPEKDELIINLKILSQVDKNRKLLTKESLLNIEPIKKSMFLQFPPESIRRWWTGNNRDETLKKIDNIVEKCISMINKNKDLGPYLINSITGIKNLKETYSECPQTRARLDVIIDKINNCIVENNLNTDIKLKYNSESESDTEDCTV